MSSSGLPSAPPHYIDRRRLDHLLVRGEGRLVRVLAPAGYGKTSLVARWAATDHRQVRWIDLARTDDDPVALFGTLRAAFAGIVDIPQPSTVHEAAPNPYVRVLEEALSSAEPAPFLVVVDDVHRAQGPGANRLLSTIVEHVPPHSTVVFAGRGHHDEGAIGRMRLHPGVVDLTVSELAFDESEAHRLFDSIGADPAAPEAQGVLRQLEGWPAGLRLAGEVARSAVDLTNVGSHVNLVDYLRHEWLGRLADGEVDFLREVACLDRLNGQECDAVLERSGSEALLRRLHRDQVVVFALDERDDSYRMHGLLRRWLTDDLRHGDPARWARIQRNAAAYRAGRGDVDDAVAHALAAGDLEMVEALVTAHGGAYFTRGLDATVEKWLDSFEAEHVCSSPGLTGLQCVKELHRGDGMQATQWMHLADRAMRNRQKTDPVDWWVDVLHAALDERPAAELVPLAAEARTRLGSGAWAGFACWVNAALHFLDGDLVSARELLENGVFEARLHDNELIHGHCSGTLSLLDDYDGDEAASSAHARAAYESVSACGGELLTPAVPAMATVALDHARRGDRDAAVRIVVAARRRLHGYQTVAPWLNVLARVALLRTTLLVDDLLNARDLAKEVEHHVRHEPPASDSSGRSAAAYARELVGQVDSMHRPATGSTALTEAELGVLHLLPTNLSLADIGAQLYVSRNTVKSHVASIYRKLDAERRSDAVERARSAGLLPSTTAP